jgi:ABC-type multidrug transport system fused ATPase/permease subunit
VSVEVVPPRSLPNPTQEVFTQEEFNNPTNIITRIEAAKMARELFNLPSNRPVGADGSFTGTIVDPAASSSTAAASRATSNATVLQSVYQGQQQQPAEAAVAPAPQRRFLGLIQVRALVGKNLLSKWRTPLGTFFEVFSPVLMMLVLVAAYQLSEITTEEAQQYSSLSLAIPGPFLDLASQAVSVLSGEAGDLGGLFTRQRKLRSSSTGSTTLLSSVHGVNFLQELGLAPSFPSPRRLQTAEDAGGDSSTTATGDDAPVFDFLDGTSDQLTSLLKNPVPVPTFDEFVSISRALSSVIDADNLPIILSDSSYGRSFGNLLTLGTLHLSPDSAVVNDFATYLNATYSNATMEAVNIRIHKNEKTAVSFIKSNLNDRTWALLDFSNFNDKESNDVSYKIRMNYTTLPNTNQIVNFVSIGLDTQYERYYLSGYLTLQRTLNDFAMSRTTGCGPGSVDADGNSTTATSPNMWSMPMPTAAFNQNSFFQAVGFLLGLTMAMAFLYPVSRTIKTIVEEKELRLKETLYILGVRPWAHWLSWLLTSLILFAVITILVTWTLTANILTHSNPVYILVYITFFSTSTIGFCFVIAACFSRAKLAAIVGPMALFATLLPRFIFFGTNRYEAIAAKRWASLLPCTAFAFGADIIADYEYSEVGVQTWNAGVGDYSFNTAVGFLFLDTLLYIFLGWYLELVIPRQYGVGRPWYFLILPSYWGSVFCCCFTNSSQRANPSPGVVVAAREGDELDFEPMVDSTLIPRVDIQDLVKRYNKNPDVPAAVNHLNLTLYESQITCLLGHNGAGKSVKRFDHIYFMPNPLFINLAFVEI